MHCIHAGYCDRRSSVICVSVCLLVTSLSAAKTVESIETPLGWGQIRVAPRIHVLDAGPHLPREWAILGLSSPLSSIGSLCCDVRQKRPNRSRCRLAADSCGPKKTCVRRGQGRMKSFAVAWDDKMAMRLFVRSL